MPLRFYLAIVFTCYCVEAFAQTDSVAPGITDTIHRLNEVEVKAYFSPQSLLSTPGSVSIIDAGQLRQQPDQSLVTVMNTVPGIRMEERSPGSYRLSIRGSLLRSPFGIRNVKIYLDEFPLTDAGGNTYLNLLDAGVVNSIEVLKGPEASIYGANSGGVVLIDPVVKTTDSLLITLGVNGGSYGMVHEKAGLQKIWKKYRLAVSQGYQRSDGYRDNSQLQRHYVQLHQQWQYSPKGKLKLYGMLSNLNYNTPGGLTKDQMEANPEGARPPTATLPGAEEQKAGVHNQTVYAGISNEYFLHQQLRNVVAVFGSHTGFTNPFITNYEERTENTWGARTYLAFNTKAGKRVGQEAVLGAEVQQTFTGISNSQNKLGVKDSLNSSDEVNAGQYFLFGRYVLRTGRWVVEASASLNFYNYHYRSLFPVKEPALLKQAFDPQVMPRLALSYKANRSLAWRISASRGYSPPTIAEIRPSNNLIYTGLQAESGWNYETGIRLRDHNDRIWWDASIFYYRLQDAIVRYTDTLGAEFFQNAGGTRQFGFESQVMAWLVAPKETGFVHGLQLRNSFTYNHFRFREYESAGEVYTGNKITGVPEVVTVSSLELQVALGFYLFTQYSYTGKLPLNDANTEYADPYHLLQAKVGWKKRFTKFGIHLYASVDNLLNQRYSLGSDLNAAAGRYYNPAPLRNYYGGVEFEF